MAASDSQLAAGRSLAGDLRAIRRKHGIDLKEVLDATRLADDVIDQLEEDALVNHPAFNRVYLRSLFGAYGDAIGIKRDDMVAALEEVFEGNYVGSLARRYLGHVVDESDMDAILTARTVVEEDADLEDLAARPQSDEEVDETAESRPDEEDMPPIPEAKEKGDTRAAPEAEATEEDIEPSVEERKTIRPAAPENVGDETVWTGLPDRKTVLLPNMSGTALVVIAGIAFVALLWFAISTVVNLGADDEPAVVQQDSTAMQEVFRPAPVVLPDTMEVAIIAFTEPLDPIRITADRDLRKPYWVELLDTHRVVVTQRLLLEREADHTRVLVDGFAVPQEWLMEPDPVDISRNRVQAWLDSLVAEGIAPQREPVAPPAAIERP